MRTGYLRALISISFILLISMAVSQPPNDRIQEDNPYQVIIKNNLFRPLGWNPKPQKPPYRLLGTVLGPDDQAKALIRVGEEIVYVKVGERIGGAVLKEVREKRAVLEEDGKPIELKIERIGFLGSGGGREGRGSPKGERAEAEQVSKRIERARRPSGKEIERVRRRIPQEILDRIPPQLREKFMRASPQERREMIRNFIRQRIRGRPRR